VRMRSVGLDLNLIFKTLKHVITRKGAFGPVKPLGGSKRFSANRWYNGVPKGIRTPVTAVKGRRANHLERPRTDETPCNI
jgi:hypothetical protein